MYQYMVLLSSSFFFFNDTATTEIYTLSLHDALPISGVSKSAVAMPGGGCTARTTMRNADRKSTRLNSSHLVISYAGFCLKKKIITTFNGAFVLATTIASLHRQTLRLVDIIVVDDGSS